MYVCIISISIYVLQASHEAALLGGGYDSYDGYRSQAPNAPPESGRQAPRQRAGGGQGGGGARPRRPASWRWRRGTCSMCTREPVLMYRRLQSLTSHRSVIMTLLLAAQRSPIAAVAARHVLNAHSRAGADVPQTFDRLDRLISCRRVIKAHVGRRNPFERVRGHVVALQRHSL